MGCGTDVWRFVDDVNAALMTDSDLRESEKSMIRSKGHCNTMGTASTMAVMAEALGMTIPGVAGTPASDSGLLEYSHNAGRLAVEMVEAGRRPSAVLTMASFHNAIVALAATGGSTNAIVHLLAIAGRLGVELRLDDFDRIGSSVPLLLNLQPAGRYLMDDLHRAGGLPAVLREVADLLDPAAMTVTGKPLVDYLPDAQIWDDDVIRRRNAPLQDNAGIAVLRGTLAPDGAVIKPAAASKELLVHRGRAVVFDSIEELHARLDDPDLDIDESCVLVLRGCGPKGYPGMPEAANTPIPPKLLAQGRPRPDPDQRRPDERYRLRHRRAARRARVGGGRPAVAGAGRRHDRAGRPRPAARSRRPTRGTGTAAPVGGRCGGLQQAAARLAAPLRRPRPAGRQGCRPRLPGRLQR